MTLVLTAIVKDEAANLGRWLTGLRPYITSAVICDTGSTDGTPELAARTLADLRIPGEVFRDEWVSFAHNRNLALERCQGRGDFGLICDADETLTGEFTDTGADGYYATCHASGFEYQVVRLMRLGKPWRWEGVVHEVPVCDGGTIERTGLHIHGHGDGIRNRAGHKFLADALALERAERSDRNLFYLGQSYENAGCLDRAIGAYEERVRAGGWSEEVYYSLWRAAECRQRLRPNIHENLPHFLRAHAYRPTRLEALLSACVHLRAVGDWPTVWTLAAGCDWRQSSEDLLFVDTAAGWRLMEEAALASYYLGRTDDARAIYSHLAGLPLPPADRQRITEGLRFSGGQVE